MRVNASSEAPGVTAVPDQALPSPPRLGQDTLTLTSTETLSRALDQTPLVRSDKVAQARNLVLDPSYPPPVLIRKFCALIGEHLDPAQPAEKQ